MKSLSRDEIAEIAALSMLDLSDGESEQLSRDLSRILKAFEALEQASVQNTDGGERGLSETSSLGQPTSHTRPDVPRDTSDTSEQVRRVFPESRDGYLVVPAVLERDA